MEISSIKYNDGKNRLTIEKIKDRDFEYRIVWRGTKVSKDSYVDLPAYFDWDQMGMLIRQAFESGKVTKEEIDSFMYNFIDIKLSKEN